MHVSHVTLRTVASLRPKLQQRSQLFRGPLDIDVVSTSRRKVAQHQLEAKHNNCSSAVNARYALRVPAMNGRTMLWRDYGTAKYQPNHREKSRITARDLYPLSRTFGLMCDVRSRFYIQFECIGGAMAARFWVSRKNATASGIFAEEYEIIASRKQCQEFFPRRTSY